jgi:hypothetical protein
MKSFYSFLLLFIFTVATSINTNGQNVVKKQFSIIWNNPLKEEISFNTIKTLSFDKSVPSRINNQWPAYFTIIPLNNNEIVNIDLTPLNEDFLCNAALNKSTKIDTNYNFEIEYFYNRGIKTAKITIEVFRKNGSDDIMKLNSFALDIGKQVVRNFKASKGRTYSQHSVLSEGQWYKIATSENSIYKVTASQMTTMGFSTSNLDINSIRLYGNGGGMLAEANSISRYDDLIENAIEVHDLNSNGLFDGNDFFLFVGSSPTKWTYNSSYELFIHQKNLYDDFAYYFITVKTGQGKRVAIDTNTYSSPNVNINTFTDYKYYENDSLNLIKTGREWYGEQFSVINAYTYKFRFNNIDANLPIVMRFNSVARSTLNSTMLYRANGNEKTIQFSATSTNYLAQYATSVSDTMIFKTNNPLINVDVIYSKPNSSATAWLNYIEINAKRHLTMVGEQMTFREPNAVGLGNVAEYTIENANANTKVWDITNPLSPIELNTSINNNTLKFTINADSLKTFVAHSGDYKNPKLVKSISNQDLHSLSNIDYVIIYHEGFKSQAEELAQYHRENSNLKVYTTTAEPIYNEFSSGAKDITAIRDFMKMLYDKASGNINEMPKYLLLFGDASYDYKDRIANNTNMVPTYESSNSLSPTNSYCTDDYFGLLDDNEGSGANGNLDIGIGRFPITTVSQANNMVNKVKRYKSPENFINNSSSSCNTGANGIHGLADWRNINCFIGDDEDGGLHTAQADYLANYVWNNYPDYNIDKIFFDAYTQVITPGGQRYPEVNTAINQRVEKGALIINYTGHGGEEGWSHESVLEVKDINSWKNYYNLPLFVTATCEFSRYEDPGRISAGEYVLINPNGGGIALLTTSRVTYSSTNFSLSKVIYQNILEKINGEYPTLGDVIRISKIGAGSVTANKNFVLLGDPALKLVYPYDDIITTAIIDTKSGNSIDTARALQEISIKGEVQNAGILNTSFNGVIYPTIFDKAKDYSTLGNDADSPIYNFKLQNNIIYKGKVRVVNGKFEFTLIIPKDISYNFGDGKISYYAADSSMDANGYMDSLTIGGSNNFADIDEDGPKVRLFINDTNFVDGGITNENPKLLAHIFDEHGINTVGNGIGHDITAILDANSSQPIVLNDYYESELDNFQRGSVQYPFYNLDEGTHTLSLKVWDVYNNSTTANIDFLVSTNTEFTLDHLLNAPNPVYESTSFIFEHNQSCDLLDLRVLIYNINGQLVRELKATVNSSGFRVGPGELVWDGTGTGGERLAKGVYVYKVLIENSLGVSTEKTSKLVLMK